MKYCDDLQSQVSHASGTDKTGDLAGLQVIAMCEGGGQISGGEAD